MTEEEWDALPLESVAINRICYMVQGLDLASIWPEYPGSVIQGPIRLALLNDGSYVVRDGRHRLIRATLAGHEHIQAKVARYETTT